jgi:hypothetical protein
VGTSAEFEELLARHFDGDLDAAGEARLDELLQADPAAFERFRGLLGIEGLLRAREADGAALPGRVLDEVKRRRLTNRVMDSVRRRPATGRRLARVSPLPWIAAAAAVLLAVAASLWPRTAPPSPVVHRDPVPAPAPVPEPPALVDAPPPVPVPAPAPVVVPAPPPAPAPVAIPAPSEPEKRLPDPVEPPKTPGETAVAVAGIAAVESVEGDAFVVDAAGRRPARAGTPLLAGQGLDAPRGAVFSFADGTRISLAAAEVRDLQEGRKPRGKRLTLLRGAVELGVARQPADQPFAVVTPHAEVRVLGTSFRVSVAPDGKRTLVDVDEGKVRVVRARDGKSVDLAAGQAVDVGPEPALAARPTDPDDVVLSAERAVLAGGDWRLVADPRVGAALESRPGAYKPSDHVEPRASWASWTFWARAEREYVVWLRGASLGTGDPWLRDHVTVQPIDAKLSHSSPFFGTAPTTAFVFSGLGNASAYQWFSGEKPDAPPLRIRFAKSGLQTFRVYAAHPGVRVDAVWLSTAQSARPAPRQAPPADK